MAKDKQEDNRDIFERALDYAPIAGAVIGGAVGVKAGKKLSAMKKAGDLKNLDRATDASLKRHAQAEGHGARHREYQTLDRLQSQTRKIRGSKPSVGSRVAGGVAGAYSGALAGATARSNYESKRRK